MVHTLEKFLTGIIYCEDPQPVTGNHFLKYRNIKNEPAKLNAFCDFARKFPSARYVNFYGKKSKSYVGRMYL